MVLWIFIEIVRHEDEETPGSLTRISPWLAVSVVIFLVSAASHVSVPARFREPRGFLSAGDTTLSPQDIAARARRRETTAPHSLPRRRHRHNGAQILPVDQTSDSKCHETRALAHRNPAPRRCQSSVFQSRL